MCHFGEKWRFEVKDFGKTALFGEKDFGKTALFNKKDFGKSAILFIFALLIKNLFNYDIQEKIIR